MPICSKCYAELPKDAKCCPNLGVMIAEPEKVRKKRRTIISQGIALIVLIVITLVIGILGILPVRMVNAEHRVSVPHQTEVNTLDLHLTADVAHINIAFENLTYEMQSPIIIVKVSATANVGIYVSPDFLSRFMPAWDYNTEGNVLKFTVAQEAPTFHWPWYSSLNITLDIVIHSSMNTHLNVMVNTGEIEMHTTVGVVLESVIFEADKGRVEATLVEDVTIAGDISIKTTTGIVVFCWDNIILNKCIKVDLTTNTGGVDIDVKQHNELFENVTLKAKTTTGEVDLTVDLKGNLGAIGRVAEWNHNVQAHVNGFVYICDWYSNTESLLRSQNYPAGNNFDITLKTTRGRISIDAKHTP